MLGITRSKVLFFGGKCVMQAKLADPQMEQNIFLCQVINKNGLQDDLIRNGYGLYKPV